MEKVRAKFFVKKIEKETAWLGGDPLHTVTMVPVYNSGQDNENKVFTDATPSGEMAMQITVPETAEFFDVGQEYYIDFTRA